MYGRSPIQFGPTGGTWREMFRATPVTWSLLAINVLFFLFLELQGGSQDARVLVRYGAKYGPAIADGEYWRLVIPVFMHIGAFHLIANSVGLVIFGGIVERSFGWAAFLTVYLVAGIAGNVASYAAGPHVGAGASGAIFGLVGAFGVYLYLNRTALGPSARGSLGGLVFILLINIIFGLSMPGIDNWAHFGGLIAGGLLALRLSPRVVVEPVYDVSGRGLYGVARQRRAPTPVIVGALGLSALILGVTTVLANREYAEGGRFARAGGPELTAAPPTGDAVPQPDGPADGEGGRRRFQSPSPPSGGGSV